MDDPIPVALENGADRALLLGAKPTLALGGKRRPRREDLFLPLKGVFSDGIHLITPSINKYKPIRSNPLRKL